MRRFINWVKSLFNRAMDQVENPDMMLDQARRDMMNLVASNKERAVQAITQRNRLDGMLAEAKQKSESMETEASRALQMGKREEAVVIMRQKINNDTIVAQLQTSFDQASTSVEQIKLAVKRQEEEVRRKTAEALALKAQWQQAQIQNSIAKALDGFNFESQMEGFGAVKERIRTAQSEASARNEMMGSSLEGKLAELQDRARDDEAESELQKLESRLGMRTAAPPAVAAPVVQSLTPGISGANSTETATDVPVSEAEQQLEQLEQRLKNQGT